MKFTNTETHWPGTLPPAATAGASPRGLGRDGHKPLMRNRTLLRAASPIGMLAATLWLGLALSACRREPELTPAQAQARDLAAYVSYLNAMQTNWTVTVTARTP